jgi:NADH-quinone oxidoreductase subunit G
VVAFSQFACASTRDVADVILPIGALPEIDATLTNLDGREQSARAGGKLPGEAREGWRVLRALGGDMALAGFDFTDLAGLRASLAPVSVTVAASAQPVVAGEGLEVASTAAIYRTDAVVRRARRCSRIRSTTPAHRAER